MSQQLVTQEVVKVVSHFNLINERVIHPVSTVCIKAYSVIIKYYLEFG